MNVIDEYSIQDVRNNAPVKLWKDPAGNWVCAPVLSLGKADGWVEQAKEVFRLEDRVLLYEQRVVLRKRRALEAETVEEMAAAEKWYDAALDEVERVRREYGSALRGAMQNYLELTLGTERAGELMDRATGGQVADGFIRVWQVSDPWAATTLSRSQMATFVAMMNQAVETAKAKS